MRYLGHPIAAAVDAAPMRRECDEILMAPSEVSLRVLFISERVRKVPLRKTKRGPQGKGWLARYRRSALIGQRVV